MSNSIQKSRHGRILFFVFLLVVAVIILANIGAYRSQKESLHEAATRQLHSIAELKVRQITEWWKDRMADAVAVNDAPWLNRQVQRFLATPTDAETRGKILDWMTSLRRREGYRRVLLLDTQQKVHLSVPADENWLGERVWLKAQEALQSKRTVVSDLHLSTVVTNYIKMDWLVPVEAPGGLGPPVAVFLMEVDPSSQVFPMIQTWPVPSGTAETLLVRREGPDVVFLNELRHRSGTAIKLRIPIHHAQLPAALAARGKEGFVEGLDYRDVPVLAVARRVPGTPWGLVVKMDHDEVCAQLRQVAFREGMIGLALVALAGLALLLVWRERERHLLQQELAMTERVAHVVKSANDIILLSDEDWNIIEVNDRAIEKYGYTREEFLRMNVRELRTPEAVKDFERQMKEVGTQGTVLETTHRRKDGTPFLIESSVRAVEMEGRRYYQGIIRDITERKRIELELLRMNRLYAALSRINEAVLRVQTQEELFREVCRGLIVFGGFKLAWIGWLDRQTHMVSPLAEHGDAGDYLKQIPALTDDQPNAWPPTSTAVCEGRTSILNALDDPAAGQCGLYAAASIPIRLDGKTWGAITVYADEPGVFGDKEMTLLKEVAANISHAMEYLDQQVRQHEAERWLADNEERFRQMFTNMSSGVAVYRANHDGTDFIFQDLNPAGEAITRVSVDDVVGHLITETFPGVREMGLLAVLQRVWQTGVAEHFSAHIYQDEKLTFWAENYIYRLSTGEIVAVFDDVTASKQAETERARLFTAMEQAAETVVITDTDARILYVNPAFEKITGYKRHEVLGQNPRVLQSGKQDAAFYRQMWDTLARGEVWHGHFINKRKDGTLYEEDATISPVRDESGQVVSYIALKLDVTRETELQAQLQHAMKMKAVGQLAGGMAHDFNNLMNVVMGYSELALDKLDPSNPLFTPLSQIKKAGERATTLTRQLLTFSRKQVLEPKVLNLNAVISDLHKMLRRLVREDIDIVLSLAPELGCVRVDLALIEQVIANLVVNARDAMPQGGKLTLETSHATLDDAFVCAHPDVKPCEYVQLAIRDTGVGMTDEVKAHVFEPFYTTKPFGEGTGLGLATCYGAITQSDGYILVESAVGQGSVFRIYLPRVDGTATPTPVKETTGALPTGRETILVVEDHPAVQKLAEMILTGLGYQVLLANNGKEALRVAEANNGAIHLLMTDVIMPEMNGRQLADEVRKRYPTIKVLFVSGYAFNKIVSDGMLEPGVAFLQKPYLSASLAAKVRELFST